MENQNEIHRIDDSTMKELAAIIENHNRELRDQEIKGLHDQLEKLKWILEMKIKTLRVREASNQILIVKHKQVECQCKHEVDIVNNKLNNLKSIRDDSEKKTETVKMHFRQAKERWEKTEEKFIKEIEDLTVYIQNLHLTLERNGITNDQLIEESDGYETDEYEVDWSEYLNRPDEYESDTQFEDDDDDDDCDDDFDMPRPQSRHHSMSHPHRYMQHERSLPFTEQYDEGSYEEAEVHLEELQCSEPREPDSCELIEQSIESCEHEDQDSFQEEEIQYYGFIQGIQCIEEPVETVIEPSSSALDPQETNSCAIISSDDSGFEQNQSSEFVLSDLSAIDTTYNNEDELSQEALSNSNAEVRNVELKSVKQIEALPFNMDPFVHGYVEKSKSKTKKPRQNKSKSKPKFSNLVSLGRY